MVRRWLRFKKLILHNVLHADDTPHKIALGGSIASFVAFLPIVGVQTIVAIALAAVFRANKAICVPIVWITNPATFWPIYGACLLIGRAVTPSSVESQHRREDIRRHMETYQGFERFFDVEFWKGLLQLLLNLGVELWVGCLLVGIVAAAVGYFAICWIVVSHRERHRQRVLRRSLFRAERKRSSAGTNAHLG